MNTMVSGFPLSYQKHHHPLSSSQSQEPLDIICHVPPIFHLLLGQVLSSTMETSPGIAQYCLTAQTCHQHITSSLRTICSYRVKCTLLDNIQASATSGSVQPPTPDTGVLPLSRNMLNSPHLQHGRAFQFCSFKPHSSDPMQVSPFL